jgi:membrane-associated phospholipid phosphatase
MTTPGHGSFPSGHSTQTHAVAHVLKVLLKLDPNPTVLPPKYATVIDQLDRQAARIATNRVVAGVHFPVDSMAGRMLGVALGQYFVGRCLGNAPAKSRKFNAGYIDSHPTTDFNPFTADQRLSAGKFYSEAQGGPITQSLLLNHLWQMASAEWSGKFP